MHKKLAGYVFLSLFSFSFFTVVLHASAQAPATPLLQVLSAQDVKKKPTPTIYVPPTQMPQPSAQPAKLFISPTPTVYIVPVDSKQAAPASKALSTDEVTAKVAEPTPTPQITQVPTQAPAAVAAAPVISAGDLEPLFDKYSTDFGINKEDLKGIAKCESGFNTNSDTGLYAGMFQFNASTWASTRNAMGLDPNPDLRKNAEEAIRTAAFKIKNGGRGAWPNC